MTQTPQCFRCARYRPDDGEMLCDAFPDGIPGQISFNKFDHTKAYDGDNGIRFEPLSDAAENPPLLGDPEFSEPAGD